MIVETELSTVRRRRGITKQQLMAVLIASQVDDDNTVIFDEFTGADGTNIVGREPSPISNGNVWTRHSSGTSATATWQILSNEANRTSTGSQEVLWIASSVADIELTLSWRGVSGTIDNFAVVRADSVDYWMVNWSAGAWRLFEYNGSTFTSRASASFSITLGVTYNIRITCIGQTITLFVDDVETLSYALASRNELEGGVGLRENNATSDTRWDNFKVVPV